jgi:hypothetical protein
MVDPRNDPSDVTGGGFATELGQEEISEHLELAALEVKEKLEGEGLSEDRLKMIERELARHSIRFEPDRQVNRSRKGPSTKDHSGTFGEGLKATSPGQKALQLDTSATLGESDKPEASIGVPKTRD